MNMNEENTTHKVLTNQVCDKTILSSMPLEIDDYLKLDKDLYRVLDCRSSINEFYELDLEICY